MAILLCHPTYHCTLQPLGYPSFGEASSNHPPSFTALPLLSLYLPYSLLLQGSFGTPSLFRHVEITSDNHFPWESPFKFCLFRFQPKDGPDIDIHSLWPNELYIAAFQWQLNVVEGFERDLLGICGAYGRVGRHTI